MRLVWPEGFSYSANLVWMWGLTQRETYVARRIFTQCESCVEVGGSHSMRLVWLWVFSHSVSLVWKVGEFTQRESCVDVG